MISVFYIDDEPILLTLMEMLMKRESDIQLTTFEKAHKALEQMEAGNTPDLLISDIKMPEMNGFELLQTLLDKQLLSTTNFCYCTSFGSLEGASSIYGITRKDLLEVPFYKKPFNKHFAHFIREHAFRKQE